MTRMVTCKNEEDVPVKGVSFQVMDGKIEAVIVTDEDGNSVRIVKSSDYASTLKVLKQAPQIAVEKWFVTGKLLGVADFEQEVESEYDGDKRIQEIMEDKDIWDKEKLGLTVESRTVMIDDTTIN